MPRPACKVDGGRCCCSASNMMLRVPWFPVKILKSKISKAKYQDRQMWNPQSIEVAKYRTRQTSKTLKGISYNIEWQNIQCKASSVKILNAKYRSSKISNENYRRGKTSRARHRSDKIPRTKHKLTKLQNIKFKHRKRKLETSKENYWTCKTIETHNVYRSNRYLIH